MPKTINKSKKFKKYSNKKNLLNKTKKGGNDDLSMRIRMDSLDEIKAFFNKDNVNNTDNSGLTSLMEGITPLMEAVNIMDLDIIKYLIEIGADVNAINNRGMSAYSIAINNDASEEIINILTDNKATTNLGILLNINIMKDPDDTDGFQAKILNSFNEQQLLDFLKTKYPYNEIALPTGEKYTVQDYPLIVAIKYNNFIAAREIIKTIDTLNLISDKTDNLEIYIVEQGQPIFYDSNETPLIIACRMQDSNPIADLLLKKNETLTEDNKMDINAKSEQNMTALGHVVGYSLDMVNLLLKNGADPNITFGEFNHTPLFHATQNGHYDIMSKLCDYNADPNIGEGVYLPLFVAVNNDDPIATNILLNHNANPNIVDDALDTPLINASRDGHFENVKLLMSRGADLSMKNAQGQDAPKEAYDNSHVKILQYFAEAHNSEVAREMYERAISEGDDIELNSEEEDMLYNEYSDSEFEDYDYNNLSDVGIEKKVLKEVMDTIKVVDIERIKMPEILKNTPIRQYLDIDFGQKYMNEETIESIKNYLKDDSDNIIIIDTSKKYLRGRETTRSHLQNTYNNEADFVKLECTEPGVNFYDENNIIHEDNEIVYYLHLYNTIDLSSIMVNIKYMKAIKDDKSQIFVVETSDNNEEHTIMSFDTFNHGNIVSATHCVAKDPIKIGKLYSIDSTDFFTNVKLIEPENNGGKKINTKRVNKKKTINKKTQKTNKKKTINKKTKKLARKSKFLLKIDLL